MSEPKIVTVPKPEILILEFGSQHTGEIVRCLRDLGHSSFVLKPEEAERWLEHNDVRCIIGSGGMKSVYDDDAPLLPEIILDKRVPYFGICYGMQILIHYLGGRVEKGQPEYARANVVTSDSPLFLGLGVRQEVWMSHADSVTFLPSGFRAIATSAETGHIAGIAHKNGKWSGVQFHPEVERTPGGMVMLKNLVENVARCKPNIERGLSLEAIRGQFVAEVGAECAIIGFSGGVDSTTLAKVADEYMGDRLRAITIDGGHLREGEIDEIKRHAQTAGVQLKIIDASEEMVAAIAKTTDSEAKRAIFSRIYERIFTEQAREFAGGREVVILQATLAPDRIESGKTGGAKIKSHHNVGLTFGGLSQLHPFGSLYKDEVRKLARELGLPKSVSNRPPFPGPGNFLRVVGITVTREALSVVQWAEARTREVLKRSRVYRDISQLVVATLGRATGVKGDAPVYGYIIAVRGVRTRDFMTVAGVEFSQQMQRKLKKLLGEHPLITQVGFFPMDKPPGTTEFE
ncbi:MAG: gamma-glutamyl-gamma-aminobutyrate hydrolase family protein [bacterium]|nr:gamma-glutamyl-gamma-aminobutyrate hydrolase family protein [bacterium]